jgi:2-methylisocitrate lyase-like PEP mutase family enzyme
VYMTGFGATAGLLARPDVGLIGLHEMADNARRVAAATNLAVLAGAGTGCGNAIDVAHAVRTFEQAGVGGIHIEDQMKPKKCGHKENKSVVSTDEMVDKVLAATAAMQNYVSQIKIDGTPVNATQALMDFTEFTDFIGLPEIASLEQRFGS